MNPQLYGDILRALHLSAALEKTASLRPDTLEAKTAHDWVLFQTIKEAGLLSAARQGLSTAAESSVGKGLLTAAKSPMGKGLLAATGAAIPAAAVVSHAGNVAADNNEDMRNKALQVALGIGGVGAGLLGMHRLTQPTESQSVSYGRDPSTGKMVMQHASGVKKSSAEAEPLLQKLATVGYLDVVLETQAAYGKTAETRENAQQCRFLNAEHGVSILRELLL